MNIGVPCGNVPVQSGFTVYKPVAGPEDGLPFGLTPYAKITPPLPSKVYVPTSAYGLIMGGMGAAMM